MYQEAALIVASVLYGSGVADDKTGAAPTPKAVESNASLDANQDRSSSAPRPENIAPVSRPVDVSEAEPGVDWRRLRNSTAMFLSAQHAFRLVTEPGTRAGLKGPFFEGWANSAGALHGWSDGDPFLVNYIGHPMQGAVASYIWISSDTRYQGAEFGLNRRYWMSRLRATGYSFLYSAQFEIGAVSEASIGNVQYYYPQQGMVDQVITPVIGLGWTVLEDAIDRHIIKRIESATYNPLLRALARGGLNPARTFAYTMSFRNPLGREDRPTVYRYDPRTFVPKQRPFERRPEDTLGAAPFEFEPRFTSAYYFGAKGGGACLGGGATAAVRLRPAWQAVVDVGGCGLMNPAKGLSGDSMTYMAGTRWTPVTRKWRPHLQFLIGGEKITHERADKPQVSGEPSTVDDVNGFSIGAGAGLSYKLNRALNVELATLEYRKSFIGPLNGFDYRSSLRFSTGLTLRVGTW